MACRSLLRVTLGDRVGGGSNESVEVGNVGGKTTDTSVGTSLLEEAAEELSSGANVGRPSEPTSVAGIGVDVQVYDTRFN